MNANGAYCWTMQCLVSMKRLLKMLKTNTHFNSEKSLQDTILEAYSDERNKKNKEKLYLVHKQNMLMKCKPSTNNIALPSADK